MLEDQGGLNVMKLVLEGSGIMRKEETFSGDYIA